MSDWDVVEVTPAALQTDEVPADDDLTTGSTQAQDDWSVVSTAPAQAPATDQSQDEWSVADQQPVSEWSAPGSFAAGVARGAAPTTAGLAAGLYTGAAASPFITPVGGALVGLGVGALTSVLAGIGQDKLLAAFGFDKPFAEAERQHPYAFFAGETAPAALMLKPTGALAQRGIGAAIGGGAEVVNEAIQGEGFDAGKIGIAAGAGFALPNVNRIGSKVLAAGAAVPGRYRGGNNPNPDLKEIPLPEGEAPDITINDQPEAPGSSIPTTPQMESANPPVNVARGTAEVKPPPAEIPGAGNPEGAPMNARKAAAPSDPGRNYGKVEPAGEPQSELAKPVDAVVRNDTPVTPDVAQAMQGEQPATVQQPGQAGTPEVGRTPATTQPPEAAPTNPAPPPPAPPSKVVELRPNGKPSRVEEQPAWVKEKYGDQDLIGPDTYEPTPDRKAAGFNDEDMRAELAPENNVVELEDRRGGRVNMSPEEIEAYQRNLATQGAAPTPPAERVPTGLTPEEIKVVTNARRALKQLGYERLLAEIDNRKLTPKQVAQALTKAYNASQSASGEAMGRTTGEIRTETPRKKVSTGVVAASKADAARKEKAIKFATDVYQEYGPSGKLKDLDPLDASKLKENRQRIKQAWAEIVQRNGGIDPTVRSKNQYVPLKQGEGHAETYQWLKALKASATGQNHKNFAAIHKTKGMGEVMRETGKIEGDIAHRPQLPEVAEQAETATGERPVEREYFDPVPLDKRPGADNSVPKAENELREWINDLSNSDYETLTDHYDVRAELTEPGDPASLMQDMMKTLAEAGRRRITPGKTPKGEVTSEVELPAKKVDLPEIKPTGRTLDKNSDEFKRLAAQYNQQAAKEPTLTKEQQLARSEAKERSISEAMGRSEERTPIDATNPESVWKKAAEFVEDESGAGRLHVAAQQLWARFRNPSNPSTPAASQGAKDYANTLNENFRKLMNDTLHRKLNLQANMHAAVAEAEKLGINTPYWHRKISVAEQNNRIDALPQNLKDYYRQFIVPVREQALDMAREMRDLNNKLGLGWDLSDIGKVTTKSYQPRYQVGKQAFDDKKTTNAFDPFTGRTLSGWAPNLLDRKWYALENGNQRMVFEKLDDGNIRLWRPNQPTIRIKVPSTFEGRIGDTLDLKVKGKPTKFVVDQGTTAEIEKATGGQVKFHENSLWAWTRMADDMTHAVEQTKLFESIKSSPDYQKLMTTDLNVARERGYSTQPTRLPDFATEGPYKKQVYLPDNVRWAFDDFHQPGMGGSSELVEKLRNFNTAMLKIFNTNAPLVHVLNEANLFTVGRGFKWLNPKSNFNLVRNIGTAVTDVNAQGPIQREMRNAGVNPLLASTKVHGMYGDAAKSMGMEIIRDWKLWDSVFRPWGITAKEAGDKLYHLSSDVTWRLSDYLTTLRYMEERAAGWAPEDAAARVNSYMSDYQLPATIMGSRAIQQFIAEQALTSFGRYKAGVWRSLTSTTKNLVKGDPMLRQQAGKQGFGKAMVELKARQEALGQLMVAGLIATVIGPFFDKALEKVTGIEGAHFRPRGVNAIVTPLAEAADQGFDPRKVTTRLWSPGPWINATMDLYGNKSFSGKEIFPQGKMPGIIPEAAANVAEYGLQTAIPPYATVSKTYARPEGTVGQAAGNFALEQIGADIPSDAAQKREIQIDRVLNRAEKARYKRPSGMIPDLFNRVTE